MRNDFADDVIRCFENGSITLQEADEWLRRINNVVFFDIAERPPRPVPRSTENQQSGSSSNKVVNDVPICENPAKENDTKNPLEQVPAHQKPE